MPKNEGQSYTGLIRERYDQLIERINFGDSQNTLVNQLNNEGFSLSVKTFRELLHRVRKERVAAAASAALVQTNSDDKKLTTIKKDVESEAVSTITANPIMPTERKKFKEIKLDKSKIF